MGCFWHGNMSLDRRRLSIASHDRLQGACLRGHSFHLHLQHLLCNRLAWCYLAVPSRSHPYPNPSGSQRILDMLQLADKLWRRPVGTYHDQQDFLTDLLCLCVLQLLPHASCVLVLP